jgi:hypothetical protein
MTCGDLRDKGNLGSEKGAHGKALNIHMLVHEVPPIVLQHPQAKHKR